VSFTMIFLGHIVQFVYIIYFFINKHISTNRPVLITHHYVTIMAHGIFTSAHVTRPFAAAKLQFLFITNHKTVLIFNKVDINWKKVVTFAAVCVKTDT